MTSRISKINCRERLYGRGFNFALDLLSLVEGEGERVREVGLHPLLQLVSSAGGT